MKTNTIANVILDQIGRHLGGTLTCIGAHDFLAIKGNDHHQGGVTFKINPNPKLRVPGRVTITLAFNDTYNVSIQTAKEVVYQASDIYCDQLAGPEGVIEQVTG